MIITLVAASLAAAQPAPPPPPVPVPPPAPVMDHGMMDHGAMGAKPKAKMDCCKDGCACCARDKAKSVR